VMEREYWQRAGKTGKITRVVEPDRLLETLCSTPVFTAELIDNLRGGI
jgi:hypothetical protein